MGVFAHEENPKIVSSPSTTSTRAVASVPPRRRSSTREPLIPSFPPATSTRWTIPLSPSCTEGLRKTPFCRNGPEALAEVGLRFAERVATLRAPTVKAKGSSFPQDAQRPTFAVNQGGKRKGSGCAYLESWHCDVLEFLELRKNTGDDRRRTHDMNTANWIPDLFMKRMEARQNWTLFRSNEVPELHDLVRSRLSRTNASSTRPRPRKGKFGGIPCPRLDSGSRC